jgi:hypothetical protein
MANPNQDARDGHGRYIRTPEGAAQDARAAQLRAEGWSLQDIADELGYSSKTSAIYAIRRALNSIVHGPAEQLLSLYLDRLESLFQAAEEIRETDHVVVSHGKIIRDDDGNPLIDSGPKLAAIREARETLVSVRKMVGLDAPSRVSVDAQQLGDEIAALLNRAAGDDDTNG